MVFGLFRRRQYPLPKFPATVRPAFEQACEAIPSEQLPELHSSLDRCVAEILARCDQNPKMQRHLVLAIADRAHTLLRLYPDFPEMERSLIIGAIRYFTADADPVPDATFASGFNDDVAVFNHVLEELGAPAPFIELHP